MDLYELEASLAFIPSSRTARASSHICILSPSPAGESIAHYTLQMDGQPHKQWVQSPSATLIMLAHLLCPNSPEWEGNVLGA